MAIMAVDLLIFETKGEGTRKTTGLNLAYDRKFVLKCFSMYRQCHLDARREKTEARQSIHKLKDSDDRQTCLALGV